MSQIPLLEQTNIHTFEPNIVMQYLAQNDWASCWTYIEGILRNLTMVLNVGANVSLQRQMADADRKEYVRQFGSLLGELVVALIVDPQSKLPDKNFLNLMLCHETFHTLLYLCGLADTDELVLGIINNQKKLSEIQQKKILLLLSLRSQLDIVTLLRSMDTKYRVTAVTVLVGYYKVFEQRMHDNKCAVYALRHDVDRAGVDFTTLTMAHLAYFRCSYIDKPDKHLLKENINKATQLFLAQNQRDLRRTQKQTRESWPYKTDASKPRIAVLLESFFRGHAMNRGWGAWVRSLASEFNVSLFVPVANCDQTIINDFDFDVFPLEHLSHLLALFRDYQPEMLVMPSCGMNFFGIVAANMRLAPIQIMGLGHPATTMGDCIDFVYGQGRLYDPIAFPKDVYLIDNSPYNFVPNLSKEQLSKIQVFNRAKDSDAPIHVTVVGAVDKVNAAFLALLKKIEQQSPYKLFFSFQVASVGMDSLYLQSILSQTFENLEFVGWQTYPEYMAGLAKTDIVLNPFPFGHTNTIIDTLLLGKPCVGLEGVEPATKTEPYILDLLGFGSQFSAKTLEEYEQKFFFLVERILAGETEFYDRAKVYDDLYGHDRGSDFGKSLLWVYQNAERMRAHKGKSFIIGDVI